ncbi:hypothetical protein E4U43_001227, partial [Claviceps pusilla]
TLKSAEEMEEEEKEAQSAKLQELIRRGSPEDLREANRLMKIMAGYDTRSKTNYRAKAAEEVSKIQAKARLLEERLEAFKPGDHMSDGDVFSELASALQSAQPKIQKMCEEESEDHEAVARLLEINDSIHRTVERYKLMKKGDMEGAAKVASGAPPSSDPSASKSSSTSAKELSLIDFDGEASNESNGSNGTFAAVISQSGGLENDLLGLDIGGPSSTFGQGGNISLGFGTNSNVPGPALLSSITQDNSASGSLSNQTASFSQFASFTSPVPSQSSTPQPSLQQQPQPPPSHQVAADPFAALASASTPTPSQTQTPSFPQATLSNNDDDEWNFTSSLPPAVSDKPREYKGTINQSLLRADFLAGRTTGASNSIHITFAFSNNSAQPVTGLHFQLAVTKGYELELKPQTGRDLAPKQSRGITQQVDVWHSGNRAQKVESVKLRWRATYKVGGTEQKNEMGEIPEFSIA